MFHAKYLPIISFIILLLLGCNNNPEHNKFNEKMDATSVKLEAIAQHERVVKKAEADFENKIITKNEALLIVRNEAKNISDIANSFFDVEGRSFTPFERVDVQKEFENALHHLTEGYKYNVNSKTRRYPIVWSESGKENFDKASDEFIKAKESFIRVKTKLGMSPKLKELDNILSKN